MAFSAASDLVLVGALSLVLAPPMNGMSLLPGPVTTVAIERLTDPR